MTEDKEQRMNVIFLGPPGVGKGTMADRTKDLLGVPHVSTGVLFRENVSRQTVLGLKVKSIIDRGDLVPDEVTVTMVKNRIEQPDVRKGFILDGFPRTIPQAEALKDITRLDHVINLFCPNDVLLKRLTGRRFCAKCGRTYHLDLMPPRAADTCDDDSTKLSTRDDDRLEAVQNRLQVYVESTEPLIAWYKDHRLLRGVDASGSPDDVFKAVRKALGR
jgi:adenylate kinase